ncbi:unnamed protein product [Urochloa humidicola]
MGLGGRGIVGERWSQRILWICALGSAVSLYFVAVERQAQNRARAVAEGPSTALAAAPPGRTCEALLGGGRTVRRAFLA